MFRIIFSELAFLIAVWVTTGYPLLITIFRIFKTDNTKNIITLENIFKIPYFYDMLLEFANNEWSIEIVKGL